ncbi:MAG: glycosyltransferase family 2 protein [Pyrinomonadaceae bacterium]
MNLTTKETIAFAETRLAAARRRSVPAGAPTHLTGGEGTRPPPPVLAVVVPCYDEELVVEETSRCLVALIERLAAAGEVSSESFVYFVDDGSRDATWALLEALNARQPLVKGLKLTRNVGRQNALLAGLMGVRERADCVVSIDANLRQDERAIETFLEKYSQGAHVVYGVRRDRPADSCLKRFTASLCYDLMRLLGAKTIEHDAEYRLLSRTAVEALAQYRESNLFLRGIVADLGLRSEVVPFDVRRRGVGASEPGPRQMLALALDAVTSFSVAPLRLVTLTGALIFLFSCVMLVFVLYHKYVRHGAVQGWASTVIPVYLLGGAQIMFTGLVGEYVGRIYQEVKARPRFLPDAELF